MTISWLSLFWLFFFYSFIGWCIEVCSAAVQHRKFVNRGFYNVGGYICLPFSLLWGALSVVTVMFADPLLCGLFDRIPHLLSVILLLVLGGLLLLDTIGSALSTISLQLQAKHRADYALEKQTARLDQITEGLGQTSRFLENALTRHMQKRLQKSYPSISLDALVTARAEMVFGTLFWDYSGFAFNLGGRINLLYCFFWGIAAVVWLKFIYPKLSGWIEKIPKKTGTIICNVLIVFMIANMLVSALALARYTERNDASYSVETTELNGLQRFLDDHYPDARMERIYPNAKMVD